MQPDTPTPSSTAKKAPAKKKGPSYAKQLAWSLIAALLITVLVVVGVTAKIGPGLDATELRERQELLEERQEQREEQQEQGGDNSGPG